MTRSSSSIAWHPTGTWLPWFQESDTPGHAGHCRPVLYFLGNHGLTLVAPTLWVMDPFTTGSEPQQAYPNGIAPSGCRH